MSSEISYGHVPTRYVRTDDTLWEAHLQVDIHDRGTSIPARVFGNFLEHLGFAIYGGVWAQILSNPTFARKHNLSDRQRTELKQAGIYLTRFFAEHGDPRVLPPRWTPGIGATGFGVAILDDSTAEDCPLPWAPLGLPGGVSASLGRIGGAIRLHGGGRGIATIPLNEGPSGIRQGVFLPIQRTPLYTGDVWVRPAAEVEEAHGILEVGFGRRLGRPDSPAGTPLASARMEVTGMHWQKLPFTLQVEEEAVHAGEPVDFYLRWRSVSSMDLDLLIDRALLFPSDHVDGLDPEVIRLVKEWNVPLLRWPGGNFVSHYHWRDGVGPQDLRPTRPNRAWGGLEYNFFGTAEFIRFCRLVDAEPHIVVNTGTGTPEEAAAWVEYCNGAPDTSMGRLRAQQGDETPYDVRLWEAGNEVYGAWQGGYHGAEENARRYLNFARAMRVVDPEIELIATGNPFDFVEPDLRYVRTHADRRWHRILLREAGAELEYVSLHSLPSNSDFLEHLSLEDAYYSLMAQVAIWERRFIPNLLDQIDESVSVDGKSVRLAITEWGVLGKNDRLPRVDNFGEAIYAGLFLNFVIRNSDRIPIANATALLHGGCIRKAAAQVYVDPQYPVLQQYAALTDAVPLPCQLQSPGYDVQDGPDLGGMVHNVPYVDAVACLLSGEQAENELVVAAVNQHLSRAIPLSIYIPDVELADEAQIVTLAYSDVSAVLSLADSTRFAIQRRRTPIESADATIELPPLSVNRIRIEVAHPSD